MRKIFINETLTVNVTGNHSLHSFDGIIVERIFSADHQPCLGPLKREPFISLLATDELLGQEDWAGNGVSLVGFHSPQVLRQAEKQHAGVEQWIREGVYLRRRELPP